MKGRLIRAAYGLFGAAAEGAWKAGLIKPGGNPWHTERGGEHETRTDRPLWLHAASLGETKVAACYRDELGKCAPLYVTTQTESGHRSAIGAFGTGQVGYAPIDREGAVHRFVSHLNPRGLVVFETEIWPFWLLHFDRPVWFANARLTERSFRRLTRIRGALEDIWHYTRMVCAQTADDRMRFVELGVPPEHTMVAGQVKQFDMAMDSGWEHRTRWRQTLALTESDRLLVAGSIRHDELNLMLQLFGACRASQPHLKLLLAPRHLRYVGEAERQAWNMNFRTRRVSADPLRLATADVYVLDTHGDLGTLYAAADLALMGGTLAPHGGHNPNEPAGFGVPVITGPYTAGINADLALLSEAHLVYRMESPTDLPAVLQSLNGFNREHARLELRDRLSARTHPAKVLRGYVAQEWGARG
jgi:3-deoxy-D-manno-octulosonic-acid transferase